MTSAAFFLITHNLKNRVTRSVLRLRQPRYIAGAVLAGFYFWSFLFRRGAGRGAVVVRYGAGPEMMTIILSVLALAILVGVWALPSSGPALVFSEAEIQFFFAGPVSRRQLVAYKILRSQVQSLFSAVVFSFFVFRGSHVFGMWLVFAALDVYMTFVSFARARLKLAGIGWVWRFVAVTAVVIAIAAVANRQFRASGDLFVNALSHPQRGAMARSITAVIGAPPLGTILYVPGIIAKVAYSPRPLLPATILLAAAAALFFLTTQMDIAFEDASLVASQRALTRRARMRSARFRGAATVNKLPAPFQLGERGRPEVAILWKNLIGTIRVSAFPIVGLIMPVVFAAAASIFSKKGSLAPATIIGFVGLMSTALFVFIGPQAVRTDLRMDILRLDVVKTFPLSAETLVAAELAAPLVTIALFELIMLLVSVSILNFAGHGHYAFFTTPEFVVSAVVFIVPVTAIQLLIQNGAMILFPAWNMSTESVRGFTAIGQRMLFLLGNLITLALAVLPAAALFLPALWIVHKTMGSAPIGILLATLPAAAILVAGIFIAHKMLASQFEDIDIANDIDAVEVG